MLVYLAALMLTTKHMAVARVLTNCIPLHVTQCSRRVSRIQNRPHCWRHCGRKRLRRKQRHRLQNMRRNRRDRQENQDPQMPPKEDPSRSLPTEMSRSDLRHRPQQQQQLPRASRTRQPSRISKTKLSNSKLSKARRHLSKQKRKALKERNPDVRGGAGSAEARRRRRRKRQQQQQLLQPVLVLLQRLSLAIPQHNRSPC